MPEAFQTIYLDTSYFQGYLWGTTDEKENANTILNKLESTIRRHSSAIKVKIPFIIIGELINNLVRDIFSTADKESIMHKFFEKISDIRADIIPQPSNCCYIITYLSKEDVRLIENSPTDCLIASCAICDPYSTFLLTNDKDILEATSLREIETHLYEREYRKNRLKITDVFEG